MSSESEANQPVYLQCSFCKRSFSHNRNLQQHISSSHSKEADALPREFNLIIPYPQPDTITCPACECSFFNKPTFERHFSKRHSSSSLSVNFSCTKCDDSFTSARSAANHFKSHKKQMSSSTSSTSPNTTNNQLNSVNNKVQRNQSILIPSLPLVQQTNYDASSSPEPEVPVLNRPRAIDFFSQTSPKQTQLQADVANLNHDLQRDLDALAIILGPPSSPNPPTPLPDEQIGIRNSTINLQRPPDIPLTKNSPGSPILVTQRLPDRPSTPTNQLGNHFSFETHRGNSSILQIPNAEDQQDAGNTVTPNEVNWIELLQTCSSRNDLQQAVNKLVETILTTHKRQSKTPFNQEKTNHSTNNIHPPP